MLAFEKIQKLGLEKLTVRDAFEFMRYVRRSLRCIRRRSGTGQGTDRTFPKPTVPEDALDYVRLATLDEADDLHLSTTTRTRQRIHFVHTLVQHRPSGNGSAARANDYRLGGFMRRTDANDFRFRLVCFAALGPDAALPV